MGSPNAIVSQCRERLGWWRAVDIHPLAWSAAPLARAGGRESTAYHQYLPLLENRRGVDAYLHGSADTEDAVVRLLWRESLDGLEHGVGLLWDQIIGPMKMHNQFAFPSL
jgi:hypothetical protein